MTVGDDVVLLVEARTDQGEMLRSGARGTVIGFAGYGRAGRVVVSWRTEPVQTSVVHWHDLRVRPPRRR